MYVYNDATASKPQQQSTQPLPQHQEPPLQATRPNGTAKQQQSDGRQGGDGTQGMRGKQCECEGGMSSMNGNWG